MFSKESAFPVGSGNPFLSVLRYVAHPSKGEIFRGGKQLLVNIHAV